MTRRSSSSGFDGRGVRPRALAADVENVGPLVGQVQALLNGRRRVEKPPAVGEAVGRDVEDAHDSGRCSKCRQRECKRHQPVRSGKRCCSVGSVELRGELSMPAVYEPAAMGAKGPGAKGPGHQGVSICWTISRASCSMAVCFAVATDCPASATNTASRPMAMTKGGRGITASCVNRLPRWSLQLT